jgi:hypothetical protein
MLQSKVDRLFQQPVLDMELDSRESVHFHRESVGTVDDGACKVPQPVLFGRFIFILHNQPVTAREHCLVHEWARQCDQGSFY